MKRFEISREKTWTLARRRSDQHRGGSRVSCTNDQAAQSYIFFLGNDLGFRSIAVKIHSNKNYVQANMCKNYGVEKKKTVTL